MSDYISRELAGSATVCSGISCGDCTFHIIDQFGDPHCRLGDYISKLPAADVVEVDDVAKMLTWLFADHCPCNYNDIDEWLPCVCELSNECPQPKDEFGCWKQFIKHHKAKMDGGADNGC